jgi:bifunctional non-homologous end joining protein LigD
VNAVKVGSRVVETSREDKVLFPDAGLTKGDLVAYYLRVAPTMLPHLRGRPVSMHRYPDGIEEEGFYQKQVPDYFPDWVARTRVELAEGGTQDLVVVEDAATLVYLADQACITPHVWLSRSDRLDHPDRMTFDLDPQDDAFGTVVRAARAVRDLLDEIGLVPFVQTTGSRGLHVVVPLDRSDHFDTVRNVARGVADLLARRHPDRLTTAQRKADRGDRLLLDVMRNARGQTAVPPYAVRGRPGAPVATPLDWDELGDGDMNARRYTVGSIFRRLSQKPDPWKGMGRHGRSLEEPGRRLERLREEES